MQPVKTVACPTCGKRALYSPENPHRPFCTERCKLIDLGQWATESYRIPVSDKEAFEEAVKEANRSLSD